MELVGTQITIYELVVNERKNHNSKWKLKTIKTFFGAYDINIGKPFPAIC